MSDKPERYWNYRVLVHDEFEHNPSDIRQCHYENDELVMMSAEPMFPTGEGMDELRGDLEKMMEALDREPIMKSSLSYGKDLTANDSA